MTAKQILQLQMDACFTNKNWFVSVNDAIKDLSDEHANYADSGDNHSIKQIAIHITFYNELYLNRLKGKPFEEINEPNDYTFTNQSLGSPELSWSEVKERLLKNLSEWQSVFDSTPEEKFYAPVPWGKEPWAAVIAHIIMHNAYHIGQVVTLRKQFNAWVEKLGVQ